MKVKVLTVLLLLIFLWNYNYVEAQSGFAKTYVIKFNNRSDTNYYPNFIKAIEIHSNFIYSFLYSSDTTNKKVYGTGFGIFNLEGEMLEYNSIPYRDSFNYFFPEEMITYDYETFFTSINIKPGLDGILKYNHKTKEVISYPIVNSLCASCFELFGGMAKDLWGNLILSHDVTSPNAIDSFYTKVQITKMDTSGRIIWTKIYGGPSTEYKRNSCKSVFIDKDGDYCVGISWDNKVGFYQTLFYKLDSSGNIVNQYVSKVPLTTADVHDISQSSDGSFYLATNYNKNEGRNEWYSTEATAVTLLNRDLSFKKSFAAGEKGFTHLNFEKILPANNLEEIILMYNGFKDFNYLKYDSVKSKLDTIYSSVQKVTLHKVNYKGDSIWTRMYSVREGSIYHWTDAEQSNAYDFKAIPDGSGYIIGGYSYRNNAYEKLAEPYYVPLLIRVDNDGCIIPGCNLTKTKDNKLESETSFRVWPNPFKDRLVIQHDVTEVVSYKLYNIEGKLMDEFNLSEFGENLILKTSSLPPGIYNLIGMNVKGNFHHEKILKE
ncbi:MAG: T9SS type A sorting domain-containing protein [Saprospiraceae bacterium]|nr:T9SS type A sorting domain-containing protein [Candidatus Vicinibacter affinis]